MQRECRPPEPAFPKGSSGAWRWLTALAAGVLAAASAGVAIGGPPPLRPQVRSKAVPIAVFGKDDRTTPPAQYKSVQEKIGLLINIPRRTVCTAFCVAPDVIVTAGHCLLGTSTERPPRLADFSFARNFDTVREQVRIAGHANGTSAQHVMVGTTALSMRPPLDVTRDWALVRLARPACTKGVLAVRVMPVDRIIKEAAAQHVFQIAYHRDYTPWKQAYSRPCVVAKSFEPADWKRIERDFVNPEALLLHTCDTGGASSGSPILLDTPDGPEVVGVNVGTYQLSKVLMQDGQVKKRLKADTVANTAVASAAFASRLEAFRDAAILATAEQVRELQNLLAQRQLYSGPIDGNYGPALKSAIETYEKSAGLTVTGLATMPLLQRLGGGVAAERPHQPKPRTRGGRS